MIINNKKANILLLVFCIFLSILIVSNLPLIESQIQNQFNNTQTSTNFSSGEQTLWSNLTYIKIPKNAIINNATLNITGTSSITNQITSISYKNNTYINNTFSDSSNPTDNNAQVNVLSFGVNGAGDVTQTFIKFNVNISEFQNNIINASINVTFLSFPSAGSKWIINNITTDWLPSTLNHNNLPGIGGQLNSIGFTEYIGDGIIFWVNKTDITGQINNNRGFRLYTDGTTGSVTTIASAKNPTANWRPVLTIFYNQSLSNATVAPQNVSLYINNTLSFNHTSGNVFNTKNTTSNFTAYVQTFLDTCTPDIDNYCYLPLNITGYGGIVKLDAININYTSFPLVNITYPRNSSNFSNSNVIINYTIKSSNIFNCWYTNSSGKFNTSLTCGNNITSINWSEGGNNITIYSNNSDGKVNSSSIKFTLDTTSPSIQIFEPQNISYKDLYQYNYSLNTTISDSGVGIETTWWTINNGLTNTTFTGNTTIIGLSAGSNKLQVYANDSLGNKNNNNITFSLLFTPLINDTNVSNSTASFYRSYLTNSTSGLIAYYKLDENNSNQVDASGNVNATVVTNNTFTNEGYIGGGYKFDGNTSASYIAMNNPTSLPHNGTITFWAKSVGVGSRDPGGTISVLNSNLDQRTRFNTNTAGTSFAFIKGNPGINVGGKNIVFNQWYLITGEYYVINSSTGNASFYVNDEFIGSSLYLNTTFSASTFYIGTFSTSVGGGGWFNGSVDEVRIYNRSLTSVEIRNLYYITNPTFQENANVTLSASITDPDTVSSNLYYRWLVDGVEKLAGFAENIFNYIFKNRNQLVTLEVNDTNNYGVTQNWNITTNFIYPLINITYPTNNSNFSSTLVDVNYTLIETNKDSCWYTNSSGIFNYSLTCGNNITTINWNQGVNNITIYANDTVGNLNYSTIRFFHDTLPPQINIINPSSNQEFSYNTSIEVNYTVNDNIIGPNTGIGVGSCWYNVDNISPNITTSSCQNFTIDVSDGAHTIYLYANDTLNNVNYTTQNFLVSLDAPAITLDFPLNGSFINYKSNVFLNFTATDANGISTCRVYNNFNGTFALNRTLTSITSGIQNYVVYNITGNSDGQYMYNAWCNDTTNSAKTSASNFTFIIDTQKPTINNISIFTTQGSQTVTFNYSVMDSYIQTCSFRVDTANGTQEIGNTSLASCGQNDTQFVVSAYSTYNFTLFANDTVGNLNNLSAQFTTSPTQNGTIIVQGGGGGNTVTNKTILKWDILTSARTSTYNLQMISGSSRSEDIYFINNETFPINISLDCIGLLCNNIEVSSEKITLTVGKELITPVRMTINLPSNTSKGEYINNIIAMDEYDQNKTLTVIVNVDSSNPFINIFTKARTYKLIGGIKVPYLVFSLLTFALISLGLYGIGLRKVKLGAPTSGVIGFVAAWLVLLIIP